MSEQARVSYVARAVGSEGQGVQFWVRRCPADEPVDREAGIRSGTEKMYRAVFNSEPDEVVVARLPYLDGEEDKGARP